MDADSGYLLQKKGEAWINWYSPTATYLFRCNTDVTSLLSGTSIKAVTAYVTDYITKQALKTHTIFEAVRTVLSRNSELLTDDIERQDKARKVLTKVVNALTSKSEIGGPMAAMYLLKHPDHYTNFKFRKFYVNTFIHRVEQYWHKNLDELETRTKPFEETVMLWEKNQEFFGVSAVEDYIHRPNELHDMSLYDWARLVTKSAIPKKLAEKLAKGDEYAVDTILSHKWSDNLKRVKFEVQWNAGDTTWETYTACSHLQAMDVYLARFDIKHWKDLPKTNDANSVKEIDFVDNDEPSYYDENSDIEELNNADELHDSEYDSDGGKFDSPNGRDAKWYFFKEDHPQSKTHRLKLTTEDHAFVPDFKGKPLPRRDQGNRTDYALSMLTLFKPWRTPSDLKDPDQLWDDALEAYAFTPRQNELMKFFQVRYECNDARDDYSAQLKAGKILPSDMPVGMGIDELKSLDDKMLYGNDMFTDMRDEDIEAMMTDYAQLSQAELTMLKKMEDAERLMVFSGALDDVDVEPVQITKEDGDGRGGMEWHQTLLDVRDGVLAQRKQQASGIEPDHNTNNAHTLPKNKQVNVVKIVDQSYLTNSFQSVDNTVEPLINAVVKKFNLNDEQERAFRIIANHSTTKKNEQLKMYLGGMAGTGKSRVINALRYWFSERDEEYRMICLAPTGAAAALINGSTYHSVLGINQYSLDRETVANMAEVHENLKNVDYIFIDEVSMLDCWSMYQISKKMSQAMKNDNEPFGGINMILAGDFAQLSPPGTKFSLYSESVDPTNQEGVKGFQQECCIGKALWHQFTTVVMLRQNMRQTSSSAEDLKFRKCLENLRYKACTTDDITLLKTRIAGPGTNRPKLTDARFRNVSIITRWNAYRDKINDLAVRRFAKDNKQALQTFYSSDKWKTANEPKQRGRKKTVVDPMRTENSIPSVIQNLIWNLSDTRCCNIPGKLRLCLGLPIMIKKNIATECGVTNGAEGIVVGWKSRPIDKDHMGLETVFVKLTSPAQPFRLEGLSENVVPIQYRTENVSLTMPNGTVQNIDRQQVPVVANFAMTDYCSQGRTRVYNVVDIQNSANYQSIYTALSRGVNYDGTVLIQGFDEQKVTGGVSGYLRQEFREIEVLNEITRLRFEGKLHHKIIGNIRGFLIHLYRKNVGATHVPKDVPAILKWSRNQPFQLENPVTEVEWEIITKSSKKLGESETNKYNKESRPKKQNKPMRAVIARGSQTLNTTNNISHPAIDAKVSTSNKRKRSAEDSKDCDIKSKKVAREVHPLVLNLNPTGFIWDGANWSCAYDTLFGILKNWYEKSSRSEGMFSVYANDYFSHLCQCLNRTHTNNISLEAARDEVRKDLHMFDPENFPTGAVDSALSDLCVQFFKERRVYGRWTNNCQGCGKQSNGHTVNSMLWYCSKSVYQQSTKRSGRYQTLTTANWIDAIRHIRVDQPCNNCEGTCIRQLNFNRMPATILVWVQGIRIKWDHYIMVDNTRYRLIGLMYHGSRHFTAKIVEKDGGIWFHDGARTGRQCVYMGNLDKASVKDLATAERGRKCIAGLYICADND